MTEHYVAYIGLGSNIEPLANLRHAALALSQPGLAGETQLQALSRVWASPPLGGQGPQFLNAAARLHTQLSAEALKHTLRSLEAAQGRVRTDDRNAPRTLDLDLLLYDGQVLDADIWQAAHIAAPLSELEPGLQHASGESLAQAARRLLASQAAHPTEIQLLA